MIQGELLTYTGHGFRLIPDTFAEEIALPDYEDRDNCCSEYRDFYHAQIKPYPIFCPGHLCWCGSVGAWQCFVEVPAVGMAKPLSPVRLQYLVPH